MAQDSYHLRRTNKALRQAAAKIGAKLLVDGYDDEAGQDVLAVRAGEYLFSLDYLNCEEEDTNYKLYVFQAGVKTWLGVKYCKNLPHLANSISKIARLTPDQAKQYLDGR